MSPTSLEAIQLAAILLAGPWNAAAMLERASMRIEGDAKLLRKYIRRTLKQFPKYRPRHRQLAEFLYQFCLSAEPSEDADALDELEIVDATHPTVFDCQLARFADLDIPRWQTVRDLGEWLDIDDARLLWFADEKGLERTLASGPLRHYHYRWIRKRRSGFRLIESPKCHLKQIQRRLLTTCLQRLPMHDSAHGFRRGRSVTSYTATHTNREIVLRMDLQNFFPSLIPWRLTQLLMLVGYCEDVARTITGLCTNVVPSDIWNSWHNRDYDRQLRRFLQQPHFPQGSPTSPAVANLIAYRLDSRLSGLAKWAGASYSRYADDLLFSGDREFRRRIDHFRTYVAVIAMEEGFDVNHHKTKIMSQSVCQRATGLVLNKHQNVCRHEYDLLKATLHNAVRQGPASQNRTGHSDFQSHLLGRINYLAQFNPERADKLREVFHRIQWT